MKKSLTILLVLLTTVMVLIGCSNQTASPQTNEPEPSEQAAVANEQVVITIAEYEHSDVITEKEIEIQEADYLLDVMKKHFEIEEENGFIHSIDGVGPAEGEEISWMFFVNGEMAMVGAAEYELSANDHVVFALTAWE